MVTPTAIVPASRYPHGYVTSRALARCGIRVVASVTEPDLPIARSRYVAEVVELPDENDLDRYADGLLDLAARPGVRTIIPTRPQDAYLLTSQAERFADEVGLVVPRLGSFDAATDRLRLMEMLAAEGMPVPETRELSSVERWDRDRVIKSRYNLVRRGKRSSVETAVVPVPAGTEPDAATIRRSMGHEPIAQEYVRGSDEYVFGALAINGEALATFQHRQLRGTSFAGGGGVARESVYHSDLEEAGRHLLSTLDWTGLACVEYVREAETGTFKPLEVNPRVWQSVGCAIEAGANVPLWYWHAARGDPGAIDRGFREGVRTHYLHGELSHLLSIRRDDTPFVPTPPLGATSRRMLGSWVEAPNFDLLHRDDPAPFIHQLRRTAVHALTGRVG